MTLYEGYRGLNMFDACGPCECSPSTCEFPEGVEVSTTDGTCGAISRTVDFPAGWDGACTPFDSIDTPTSIRVAPTRLGGCEPVVSQVPRATFTWNLMAKACGSLEPMEPCADRTQICVPDDLTPTPGFQQCVFKTGDADACPMGYPQLSNFYSGVEDHTHCTPCTCRRGPQSACSARVHVYDDAICTNSEHDLHPAPEEAPCSAVVGSPSQIASAEATFDVNDPGSCTAEGGQLYGTPKLLGSATLCCRDVE